MRSRARTLVVVAAVTVAAAMGGRLAAQTALAQLGVTEAAARTFVLNEIKSPATGRRSDIAIAGTRAFLKLPPAARAAAATGVFAWAKAYVNSPAFKASYEGHRRDRIPPARQYALSVDEAVKKETDDALAGMDQMRQGIGVLPPADQQKVLEKLKEAQAMLTDPAMIQARRAALEAERAERGGNNAAQIREVEEKTPANPQTLFARRLREFLAVTADVNFSARTINLTGGTDGIEFVDRADRQRHWLWQEAVLAGPEALAAARTAAQAWLKEIEP
jgi:hypothetical protein